MCVIRKTTRLALISPILHLKKKILGRIGILTQKTEKHAQLCFEFFDESRFFNFFLKFGKTDD